MQSYRTAKNLQVLVTKFLYITLATFGNHQKVSKSETADGFQIWQFKMVLKTTNSGNKCTLFYEDQ